MYLSGLTRFNKVKVKETYLSGKGKGDVPVRPGDTEELIPPASDDDSHVEAEYE